MKYNKLHFNGVYKMKRKELANYFKIEAYRYKLISKWYKRRVKDCRIKIEKMGNSINRELLFDLKSVLAEAKYYRRESMLCVDKFNKYKLKR